MTWPWARHIRDAAGDKGDSYLNAWILWWDYHQTFHDPLRLFDANILYPYSYTLAFSEHNYGIALPFFPLYALGLTPITVHGIATLAGFALCGYGAFRLARTLTGSVGAAWVAGVAFAFVPFRFHHLPHVTYLFAGWMPLLLEALVLYARAPTRRRAAWLGIAFFMNALTCIHWFVLTLIPLALTGLFLVARRERWRERAFWLRAAVALGLAFAALLPFLIPYLRVSSLYGLVRRPEEVLFFSARPAHWLLVDWQNKFWKGLGSNLTPYQTELALFPGLLPPLLALVALLLVVLRPKTYDASDSARNVAADSARGYRARLANMFARLRDGRHSEAVGIGLIWTLVGFAGSFGLHFIFHRLLFKYVPLFRSIRVPARWAMLCFVGLSLLAGLGASKLIERFAASNFIERLAAKRLRLLKASAFALVVALVLFEQRAAPLDLVGGDADPDAVTLRLKATKMRGGIVELPAGVGQSNYLYTLRAADHARPLVNGVSGFRPPIIQAVEEWSQSRPVPERFLDLLEAIPVSYLVVHDSAMSAESRSAIDDFLKSGVAAGRLRLVWRSDEATTGDRLYAVTKTEPDATGDELQQ